MKSRLKGWRSEHDLEQRLRASGIKAKRIPMSGQAFYTGDILTTINDHKLIGEVKGWKTNFLDYKFLEHCDIVFKRTIRKGETKYWLITMPLEKFLMILEKKKI